MKIKYYIHHKLNGHRKPLTMYSFHADYIENPSIKRIIMKSFFTGANVFQNFMEKN